MRRGQVAARVLRYLARQPGMRRAALRGGLGLLAVAITWRACGHGADSRSWAQHDGGDTAAKTPAFCKRFDPKALYLWGEVVEGAKKTRAIAELDAPDVYCELPSRSTFLPSIRPDRRLMFMRDLGRDGERAYLYDAGGGDGDRVETPSCTTRFTWLKDADRHLHYGCSFKDIYDKEWKPIFYRDAGAVIGFGKGLDRVFGDPSDGRIIASTRDGLAVVDIGANETKPIKGLPWLPALVRATPKGFLVLTESAERNDARLWQVAFDGTVKADGTLAALPPKVNHIAVAMTSDGEVFERVAADSKDETPSNKIVARTRSTTRTVYSDAEWKKRGKPFVRIDVASFYYPGVVTSR